MQKKISNENNFQEYNKLLNEFVLHTKEYFEFYCQMNGFDIKIENKVVNEKLNILTLYVSLHNGTRINQLKHISKKSADYIGAKYIIIAKNYKTTTDTIEITVPFPDYLIFYKIKFNDE